MKFSEHKGKFFILSVITIIILLGTTFGVHKGFKHSITFDGGIRFSLNMPVGTGVKEIKAALAKQSIKDFQVRQTNVRANQYDLEFGPIIQKRLQTQIDKDFQIKLKADLKRKAEAKKNPIKTEVKSTPGPRKGSVINELETLLLKSLPIIARESIVSREAISASYGDNLTSVAIWSLVAILIIIGLYLTLRFDLPFAIGASMALMHDVIMTVGFIGVMRVEPSVPVVAAVLTIIGYSINDTIVIFDRIREMVAERAGADLGVSMDLAITQTLSRTVVTSLLTLLAALALLFGGAGSLYDFALVLIFGVFIGTYSSIFIASHIVQVYENYREAKKA